MKLNHFQSYEFVPPEVYSDSGSKSVQLMDRELLLFIDALREYLGKKITINTWKWGGSFKYRGLRTSASDVYSKYSQHSFGKALDFDVEGMTAEEVRQWIIKNRKLHFVNFITFIEDGVNWVHVDTRPTDRDALVVWDVNTKKSQIFER